MSRSYSIAIYTLRVKKSSKKDDELNLHDKLGIGGISFYDFVERFVQKCKTNNYENKSSEQLLRVTNWNKKKSPTFYVNGIVEKGDSGYEARLLNVKTYKEKSRGVDEAELLPYYFCIAETTNSKSAVLCIQRSGQIGVKTLFQEALRKSFRDMFSDENVLVIEDHLPDFCREQFIKNNSIKRIEYSYTSKVNDVASLLEAEGQREQQHDDAIIRIVIQPTRGVKHHFKKAIDKIGALSNLAPRFVNLDDSKKINTSVTFENSNGKTRTFSIGEERDILPYIDLSGNIEIGPSGHPIFKSIESAVNEILLKDNLLKIDGKN